MMTQPESELDSTAELPQLNLDAIERALGTASDESSGVLESTAEHERSAIATSLLRVDPSEHWDIMDELISVRDKIAGLESSLSDAESKLSRQQARYDTLQTQHSEALAHSEEVSRDRERLTAERTLWMAAQQRLQAQLDQQRSEGESATLNAQQALQQQQRVNAELNDELAALRAQADARMQHQVHASEQLNKLLREQQRRTEALSAELQAANQQRDQQHATAASLARNVAQEMAEKTLLQSTLQAREQRVATLENELQTTLQQLTDSQANSELLVRSSAEKQQQIEQQARLVIELRHNSKLADERIERLTTQVETENLHWRSAEQDKTRLRQMADSERETFERTRQELAERQAEISALQERLSRAGIENDALSRQLAESQSALKLRDDLLATNDRDLTALQEAHAAVIQRESATNAAMLDLDNEISQLRSGLQQQIELRTASTAALDTERQHAAQLTSEMANVRRAVEQMQLQLQQRDKFVLEQARELEAAVRLNQELGEQIKQREQAIQVHSKRAAELAALVQRLQNDLSSQAVMLQQTQQALESKNLEQGASARQVEALQVELHQHIEAMNAIRRDIHQVALQSRGRESETMVRTLSRTDTDGVVHLLNKSTMTLGRGQEADIRIRSDSVSRQHACLRISRDAVIIEDLASTNGCYVNGKRIKRQLLKDGDQLSIGDVPLRFSARATSS